MKKTVFIIGFISMVFSFFGQNTLNYLEIKVTRGNVSAHFSRYNGTFSIGTSYQGISMKIPTGKSNFTKLFNRDDDNRRIYAGESWVIQNQKIGGPGIYILDISDWDNASVYIKLIINDQLRFEGNGTCSNFDCWTKKVYGNKVRKTDDREIAIDL